MENWNFENVKSAGEGESLSAAQREEVIQEQAAPETPAQEEPQAYQTPTNDAGDFVVNLDKPVNSEEDAIQEREATEISLEPETGDSGEVEQEVRVEPEQEVSQQTPDAPVEESFEIELVENEPQEVAEAASVGYEDTKTHNGGVEPPAPQPEANLPEGIDKLVQFIEETGGTLEDYVNLNKDVSQMAPVDTVREFYKQKYPHYDAARIERKMNKEFAYDQEVDDADFIQDKQDAFQDALYEAQNFLTQNKNKYYQDLKANPRNLAPEYQEAMQYYKEQQQANETSQKQVEKFHQLTDQVFNDEFKGFDFKVGENKYRVKVGDVNKTKEFQKDLTNFISSYLGDDGNVTNVKDYHKALYAARNADKLAQHFYEQGRADAIKQSAASAKNIDMKPRQDAASITTPSGNKFRVVSGQSSNGLKIKMRK